MLFALKVVVNDRDPNARGMYVFILISFLVYLLIALHCRILGLPIEMRYLAWAELLLIHVLMPNSSFLGHLCGIAMGYACILIIKTLKWSLTRPRYSWLFTAYIFYC